ncbi:hypothetical protein Hypma_007784 [Hypsizygus marmoreus]|uniref:Uncharacterized protein n=1 Tax=Hypsizygus marmoreus TaxID=39966 RepID=A0A369JTU8_HYPMA|nr:hypothetical protein Hypma_007784 [Hypsizygus marmoreus]
MAESSAAPHTKHQMARPPHSESFFQALKSSRSRFSMSTSREKQPPNDTSSATTIASGQDNIATISSSPQFSLPDASFSPPEPVLYLSFYGETIFYNLKSLDKDPHPIIELLRLTASERGSWMVVGAYYRRIGNTRAALSVIEAMIKVMAEQGLPEDNLKPAYLFLSSCEIDLARLARSSQPDAAEEHHKASKTWLQKVYGAFEPIPVPNTSQVRGNPASSPRHVRSREPSHQSQATSPPEGPSREILLGRQINTLRHEQKEQSALLAETRAMKRKLESEVTFEREGRRRLLRDFDDLEKELTTARKMENYALGQVKREVEARRKAEEKARAEKAMRLELQKVFEHNAVAAPFSEIANTINKADERPFSYPKASNDPA